MIGKRAKKREMEILKYAYHNSPFTINELVKYMTKGNANKVTANYKCEVAIWDLWDQELIKLDHNSPEIEK